MCVETGWSPAFTLKSVYMYRQKCVASLFYKMLGLSKYNDVIIVDLLTRSPYYDTTL